MKKSTCHTTNRLTFRPPRAHPARGAERRGQFRADVGRRNISRLLRANVLAEAGEPASASSHGRSVRFNGSSCRNIASKVGTRRTRPLSVRLPRTMNTIVRRSRAPMHRRACVAPRSACLWSAPSLCDPSRREGGRSSTTSSLPVDIILISVNGLCPRRRSSRGSRTRVSPVCEGLRAATRKFRAFPSACPRPDLPPLALHSAPLSHAAQRSISNT